GLWGLNVQVRFDLKYVRWRPGEKLSDEMNCNGEAYRPTQHPRIMRVVTAAEDWRKINAALEKMRAELHQARPARLKQLIHESVPEYTPDLTAKVKPALKPMARVRGKAPEPQAESRKQNEE